jgi:hypothetical protein
MSGTSPESAQIDTTAHEVIRCLLAVIDHNVSEDELLSNTLADIGVGSWTFTAFLARIEEEFGIKWDYDVPSSVFQSVQTIAEYLDSVKNLSRHETFDHRSNRIPWLCPIGRTARKRPKLRGGMPEQANGQSIRTGPYDNRAAERGRPL